MVDQVRPGSVPPRQNDVNDRIRALEEQVRELQAKNMDNATVGRGGTFRGYYDNGQLSFSFGRDKEDGIRKAKFYWPSTGREAIQIGPGNPNAPSPELEQWRLNDQNGKRMYATDGIAGYGLAEPSLGYFMVPTYGLNWVSGVAQPATVAFSFFYNPALLSAVQVRNFAGGVTAMAGKLRVTNADGDYVESSTSAAVGANSTITRILLLPASFMNAQNCRAEWIMTPTGSGTADVWPRQCQGVSKALYDISAGIQ